MKFRLEGRKLCGSWALVRMRGARAGGDKVNWLLIKKADERSRGAGESDILVERPESVLSGRTIEELREDKEPREVVLETAAEAKESAKEDVRVETKSVRLTSPDRVLYPDIGLTKRGLAEYYEAVADRMLPFVAGRPLALFRCPEGLGKACFFQKHAAPSVPAAVKRVEVEEKSRGRAVGLAVDSVEGLIGLVQIGALEVHAWGALADRLDRPDRIVFDLDPDLALPFREVAAAARELRGLLDSLGLRSFLKTTGGKGLHVVLPIERRSSWEEVKEFSRAVAERLSRESPDRYTSTVSLAKRKGRIYIDYLRNAPGATAVAPYSTRAKPGAPVSTPLEWEELTADMRSDRFTVKDVPRRLASLRRDPWQDLVLVRQTISAATIRALESARPAAHPRRRGEKTSTSTPKE